MMNRPMKDSGVEWIGMIPEDWQTMKFKYVMRKEKKIAKKYNNEDVISLTKSGVIVRDLDNPSGKMPASFDGYQYVEEGDLLLCLFDIDVTPRCVGIVKNDGVTSPAYSRYKLKNGFDINYYNYLLTYLDDEKILLSYTKSLRNTLTDEYFGAVRTITPPLYEQQKIAAFLDEKVSKIDSILSDTKESIEALKQYKQSLITETVTKGLNTDVPMKDSGIEWAKKIPESWRVSKVSRVTHSYSGGTPSRQVKEYWENGEIPWVASGEVNKFYIEDTKEKITQEGLNNSSAKLFPPNTVLVALNGQGKTKGMSAILKIEASTNQSLVGFICKKGSIDYRYLNYIFVASYKFNRFYYAGGDKRDGIAAGELKQSGIPLPPFKEQQKIACYLDERTKHIDSLIQEKQQLINELETYKKSLIYEYVTGKKEVK